MKSLFLTVVLFVSMTTFAQKDELKTLKKIYSKDKISEKDLEKYNVAMISLEYLAKENADKVYAKFYKIAYPSVELTFKGEKSTIQDKINVFNPEFIKEYGQAISKVIDIEEKSEDKEFYNNLIERKKAFANSISDIAFNYNELNNFKEASEMFYSLYQFDKKNKGRALENSAITSFQSGDYKYAEKRYEEFVNSDYLENGVERFATSVANGEEYFFETKEERLKSIATKLYEKPRDVNMSLKKSQVYKTYAALVLENGNTEKAKSVYAKARKLFPNDEDLKSDELKLYFNLGYNALANDKDIVDEINSNLDDKEKYDELMQKRKEMYKGALPFFEKAYGIMPSDGDTKKMLVLCYETLEMKDKAEAVK